MKYWAALICLLMFSSQAAALNSIRGTLTIRADGTLVFEGKLERGDLNVSYAFLNTARETPVANEQVVFAEFNGTELGHPPAVLIGADVRQSAYVEFNGTELGHPPALAPNRTNVSLGDYLSLGYKGVPNNATAPSGGRPGDSALLEKRGENWYFSLHLDDWMDVYDLMVEFPEGTKFREVTSNMGYDRGDASLHFKGQLVEAPRIDVIYLIEDVQKPVGPPADFTLAYIIAALAAIGCAALLVFAKKRKRKQLNPEIFKTLNEKEGGIIKLLFENGGKMTQTRLRQKTGMPRSTLSNVVRDLEARKLVKRYEHGSTWDVELEERVYG